MSLGALQSTIISIKVSPRREMREAEIFLWRCFQTNRKWFCMPIGCGRKSSSSGGFLPARLHSRTFSKCVKKPANSFEEACGNLSFSGPDRSRTDDLFHAMEALYQLSYRPFETKRIRQITSRNQARQPRLFWKLIQPSSCEPVRFS